MEWARAIIEVQDIMLDDFIARHVPLIETEMRQVLAAYEDDRLASHYGMLAYHLGWLDEQLRPARLDGGKRIRPVLCLLTCQAVGGSVTRALPAAAGLELLHNFSLIHDDIEDDSPTRRHRPTVWSLWGRAQAINAGDVMFTLAHLALHRLSDHNLQPAQVLDALRIFDETCVRLTEGQYLDMTFETRLDVSVKEYLDMIRGKTAALLGASTELGALIGGASAEVRAFLAQFGHSLGLAFQIRDDILGIWGDEALTGKSAQSDILARKKTLPVVVALSHPRSAQAMRRFYARELTAADVPAVLSLLEQAGARERAEEIARQAHEEAMQALTASGVLEQDNEPGSALQELAEYLLRRSK